ERLRHEVGYGMVRDIEEIAAGQGLVAVGASGVHAAELDVHVETRRGQVRRIVPDDGVELLEAALEGVALETALEAERALPRVDLPGLAQGQGGNEQQQEHQQAFHAVGSPGVLTRANGSMRRRVSSRSTTWCLMAAATWPTTITTIVQNSQ